MSKLLCHYERYGEMSLQSTGKIDEFWLPWGIYKLSYIKQNIIMAVLFWKEKYILIQFWFADPQKIQ